MSTELAHHMRILFNITYYLVGHSRPMTDFWDLAQLHMKNGVKMIEQYMNDKACWDFTKYIAQKERFATGAVKQYSKDIHNNARCFSWCLPATKRFVVHVTALLLPHEHPQSSSQLSHCRATMQGPTWMYLNQQRRLEVFLIGRREWLASVQMAAAWWEVSKMVFLPGWIGRLAPSQRFTALHTCCS